MKLHFYSVLSIIILVLAVGNKLIFVRCISLESLKGEHKEEIVDEGFNGKDSETGSNQPCHSTAEFKHPEKGCLPCASICNRTRESFCIKNCPYYCPQGFYHIRSGRCINCDLICQGNLRSRRHQKFCDDNCVHLTSHCQPDEFLHKNNTCLKCSSVCEKSPIFCQKNCKNHPPNNPDFENPAENGKEKERYKIYSAIFISSPLLVMTCVIVGLLILCACVKLRNKRKMEKISKFRPNSKTRRESKCSTCKPIEETRTERSQLPVNSHDPLLCFGYLPLEEQPHSGDDDLKSKTCLKEVLPTQPVPLQYGEELTISEKL